MQNEKIVQSSQSTASLSQSIVEQIKQESLRFQGLNVEVAKVIENNGGKAWIFEIFFYSRNCKILGNRNR